MRLSRSGILFMPQSVTLDWPRNLWYSTETGKYACLGGMSWHVSQYRTGLRGGVYARTGNNEASRDEDYHLPAYVMSNTLALRKQFQT
jgi:hypothetical protein